MINGWPDLCWAQIGTLYDVVLSGGVSQIHRYIDRRHAALGPIFRERLGHVDGLWCCDPAMYRQIYRNEGAHPRVMLPESWIIFNERNHCQRGLFFM